MYMNLLKNYFEEDIKLSVKVETLIQCLIDGDLEKFARILELIYLAHVSFYDVSNLKSFNKIDEDQQDLRYENFHHGFILGLMMYGIKYYQVLSNKDYGYGSTDIVLIPKNKGKTAYVFEFKWSSTKSSKTLENLVELGKKQILEKSYIEGLKSAHEVDNVVAIVVGFKGKLLKIENI
jgi:hypothetical protein